MPAWLDRPKLALTPKIAILAHPVLEGVLVVEHKAHVVEQVQNDRQVGHRREPRRLAARAIVVLVPGVDRDPEQAARTPLETMLTAIGGLNRRPTTPGPHADE